MKRFKQFSEAIKTTPSIGTYKKTTDFFKRFGFTSYSHDMGAMGYVNKGNKDLPVKRAIDFIKKEFPKLRQVSNKNGPKLWVLDHDAPYRTFVVTVESKDGKNVWNVYMKWTKG